MMRKKIVGVDLLICSKCGNVYPLNGHAEGDMCRSKTRGQKGKLCDGLLSFHTDKVPRQIAESMNHLPYREL